ncbi:MAG: transposase [Candidatus Omnitrophica bacterium]|nr:transposase [Candidatus Omnitrophota bacterium]
MARPIRINYEGAYYHVINRGRGRIRIYHDERDYRSFLTLLGECCDLYGVYVVAYCLMSNHYHLLLCTPHANLPQCMRQLNGVYTQLFNRRYKIDGTLFRGRYKAIVVQKEFYLIRVIRYIHRNPLAAGIVKRLAGYPWSSHGVYIKGGGESRWLKYTDVLSKEWMEGKFGRKGYAIFMQQKEDAEIEKFYNKKKSGAILGNNDYRDGILEKHIHSQRYYGGEIPEQRKIQQDNMAGRIEKLVCREYRLADAELKKAERGKENEGRKVAIRMLREKVGMSCKEIAQRYCVGNVRSISEYCRRLRKKCQDDKNMAKRYKKLESSSCQVET